MNLHGGGVGVYTPIESSTSEAASPRPVYFGMQFAQMFAGYRVAQCALDTGANINAYQGTKAGKTLLALVNKGDAAVRVALPGSFARAQEVRVWELRGPSLAAKTDVRFGPAPEARSAAVVGVDGYSGVILAAG